MPNQQYDNSNSGALFTNDKKRSDNSPSHTGEAELVCSHCGAVSPTWVSAWVKTIKNGKNAGRKFFSLAFTAKDAPSNSAPAPTPDGEDDFDDDIPF